MAGLTGVQIAELAGVSRQAVYKANLPKTEGGLYDPTDPKVMDWIQGKSKGHRAQRSNSGIAADLGDDDYSELERKELEWKIKWTEERAIGQQLKNAEIRKDLIPFDVFDMAIGAFAGGIRNNFLQIGNRIGRGDKELRDKIEAEIKKAIERTIEGAEAQIDQIIDRKIEELQSEGGEDEQ